MRRAALLAALAVLAGLLAGCGGGTADVSSAQPPAADTSEEVSQPIQQPLETPTETAQEPPETATKTAQELLEEQTVDDTHDAFLVDTGGELGTLLVTAERAENTSGGFDAALSVWNPSDTSDPIQTLQFEGLLSWEQGLIHRVVDANFDGSQDFGCMYAMGTQAELWHYWIWHEDLGQFVEEPEFLELSSPTFDSENQVISGWNRNSAADDGVSTFHKWIDGQLVCVRRITVLAGDFSEPFVLTVEDRLDGALEQVYQTQFPFGDTGYLDERAKWENLDYHGEDT